MGSVEPYDRRKAQLLVAMPVHICTEPPASDQIYAVPAPAQNMEQAMGLYLRLQQLNRQWRCPFYEGLVAKRTDAIYPVQLRSPTLEFPGWVKHRGRASPGKPAMDSYCLNRLTVVGPAGDLKSFYKEELWMAQSGGRHFELLETLAQATRLAV